MREGWYIAREGWGGTVKIGDGGSAGIEGFGGV